MDPSFRAGRRRSIGVVIFLDIDGVLNRHNYNPTAQSCSISPECVVAFNSLLARTGACVVLSSAWRYMIHGNAMTLDGFEYMLRTHGVLASLDIVGVTCSDERMALRGDQIALWLSQNSGVERYVVLDDLDLGISNARHPFVKTDGDIGLTMSDVSKAVNYLGFEPSGLEVA